ncbi:Xaa-Pro aminopeptidase [Pseudoalteromonas sp. SG45-5]|uniref:Xaa-Pro aminopeptidase n=1 Tax=unclassified Pseudoalteromonas TaxID=194690 RepID=UPI0015F81459|nr:MULTISPECIES: Xaa-Pro aminopeptidase [unclassified Pseudoalteromonas]MBB1387637.1 Xaa-Pro aminopeptidase [Pseudoalteromonas sp. SG45-5]MBB1395850.1 Xaa-Pro aminopeptidase [Pseudoalteromonas sp. SG44-4]MBB1448789.1 Xaa-Pro aminopeptidase [Pseudoalteromonas sp. SG41-6]
MVEVQKSEFKARRERLLAQMDKNSVAIIPAASEVTRSRDTEYAFRQDSDFFYLTGFNEPDAVLVLCNNSDTPSTLFCLNKDKLAEIWHGRRIGFDKAKSEYLFDETYALSELSEQLLNLVNGQQILFYAQGTYPAFDGKVFSLLNRLRSAPKKGYKAPDTIKDVRSLIHEMRLFKSPSEIEIMREGCEISARGHMRAMRYSHVGATEFQLEAELHHHYAMNGAPHPAYGTIVGSGDNANILHYTQNSDVLKSGDLVLIDSGCELQGYAADITRTFPINGKFSEEQAALYNVVLKAQDVAFGEVKPGGYLSHANKLAMEVMTQGLLDLGILTGDFDELMAKGACKEYYMHGLGHWLGLDVHDVGDYKQDNVERAFEPGMVLTIEPGLYISEDSNAPQKYKGIGIRIEDNLLVTENGHENLTLSVPKTISDIEALMQSAKNV